MHNFKFLIIYILIFSASNVFAQFDQEKFCRTGIKDQIAFAEWGKKFRKHLFDTCKSKDLNDCLQPYTEVIKQKESNEITMLNNFFDKNPTEQHIRYLMHAQIAHKYTATMLALKLEDSPEVIANDIYLKCISNK